MRIIKRYANRKLYDTSVRRYINLVEISDLVHAGTEVRVLDSRTGEDITKVSLSQILLEKEKKGQGFVPKTLFTNLIRKGGGSLIDYLKKSVKGGLGIVTWVEQEIDKGVKKLTRAGQLTEAEGRKLRDSIVASLSRNKASLERAVDDRVQNILHTLNIPAQSDIVRLTGKLEVLANRVEALTRKPKPSNHRSPAPVVTVRKGGRKPAPPAAHKASGSGESLPANVPEGGHKDKAA